MRYFYKFLSFTFHYILPFVIWYRVLRGKEDKKRYCEKFGKYGDFKRPAGFLVRIHGASLGETMAALPFIAELLKQRPHITVLVTSGTKTSADMMQKYVTENLLHLYAPLDTPQICKRFYTQIKPDLEIIIDSEIWVNSLEQAKKNHIPVFGLNTRISKKSQRLWAYFPHFFRSILKCYQGFFVQNDDTARMIASYYEGFIRVCTNLKWALEELDYDKEALPILQTQLKNRPVVVAISTHEGEEEYIMNSFEKVCSQTDSHPLLLIVPRHPHRAAKISASFVDYHPALRSRGDRITQETMLYIADTVGEVGLWSHLATILLIGKSFLSKGGGHNPIEPALCGLPIICGEYMQNFTEIIADFKKAKAILTITSPEELTQSLLFLMQHEKYRLQLGQKARGLCILKRQNALRPLVDILKYIPIENTSL